MNMTRNMLMSSLKRAAIHGWMTTRCLPSASERVLLEMDSSTGIATVQLNRPPVNSLNLEFLTDINIMIEKLENDKSCRGLILTSSNNKVFSAGLDIMEMYKPQPDRLAEFWRMLQNVWINLYGTHLPTIAAINGHSPAGGCLLSLCCDHRMMAPNFTIGLNETQLGIIPPFWLADTMSNVIGFRQTEKCCQLGLMMTTEQAHQIGVVDEIVSPESIHEKANNELKTWLKIPEFARQLTKIQMRKPTIDKLLARREEDIQNFVKHITKDLVQKSLEVYLKALKRKKAK